MASTFTSILKTEQMADGDFDATWGTRHNATHTRIEHAFSGTSVSVAGSSDVTLTSNDGADDQQRYGYITLTGAITGNINVIVPTIIRTRTFFNNTSGAFTVTVKTSGGTGVAVPQGQMVPIHCDGTNCVYNLPGPLQSIFNLTTSANQMLYTTGADTYATTTLTSTARELLDDGSKAAMRSTLQLGTAAQLNSGATNAADVALIGNSNQWRKGATFNAEKGDNDFIVHGDGEDNALYIDAANRRTGLNTNAPIGRLDVRGGVFFNKTDTNFSSVGFECEADGQVRITTDDIRPLLLNRLNDDGIYVQFSLNGNDGSAGTVGTITNAGGSFAFTNSSDYRSKDVTGGLYNALIDLLRLRPVKFRYHQFPDAEHHGFVAHEVQPVVPDAVVGEKDAVDENGNPVMQQMDVAKIVPLLVAAVQELAEEVRELRHAADNS